MPKFIIDECTGIAVVHFMREQGYDVLVSVNRFVVATEENIRLRPPL